MVDTYKNLASAVILQAVKDWEKSKRTLRQDPENKAALLMKEDCEEFFASDWLGELLEFTDVSIDSDEVKERIYGHQRLS